jgi:hypothetical protein
MPRAGAPPTAQLGTAPRGWPELAWGRPGLGVVLSLRGRLGQCFCAGP